MISTIQKNNQHPVCTFVGALVSLGNGTITIAGMHVLRANVSNRQIVRSQPLCTW